MSSSFDGLSVIVITKNAEKDIEKCLSSVAWVNNKIVLIPAVKIKRVSLREVAELE